MLGPLLNNISVEFTAYCVVVRALFINVVNVSLNVLLEEKEGIGGFSIKVLKLFEFNPPRVT